MRCRAFFGWLGKAAAFLLFPWPGAPRPAAPELFYSIDLGTTRMDSEGVVRVMSAGGAMGKTESCVDVAAAIVKAHQHAVVARINAISSPPLVISDAGEPLGLLRCIWCGRTQHPTPGWSTDYEPDDGQDCDAVHAEGSCTFYCTRRPQHRPPHVACGFDLHHMAVWHDPYPSLEAPASG